MARRQCKNEERSKRLREKIHFPIEREQHHLQRDGIDAEQLPEQRAITREVWEKFK